MFILSLQKVPAERVFSNDCRASRKCLSCLFEKSPRHGWLCAARRGVVASGRRAPGSHHASPWSLDIGAFLYIAMYPYNVVLLCMCARVHKRGEKGEYGRDFCARAFLGPCPNFESRCVYPRASRRTYARTLSRGTTRFSTASSTTPHNR